MKYTDGNWYTTAGYVASKLPDGSRGAICTMSNAHSSMNFLAAPGSSEDASNARLIAAAPTLYLALKHIFRNDQRDCVWKALRLAERGLE